MTSFAPTPSKACPITQSQFYSEGSAALERAMSQWRLGWCAEPSKLNVGYNPGDEYMARIDFLQGVGSLGSRTDVALVTDPASSEETAGSARQFTYAPVVNTGIVIAYLVDDQVTNEPITVKPTGA